MLIFFPMATNLLLWSCYFWRPNNIEFVWVDPVIIAAENSALLFVLFVFPLWPCIMLPSVYFWAGELFFLGFYIFYYITYIRWIRALRIWIGWICVHGGDTNITCASRTRGTLTARVFIYTVHPLDSHMHIVREQIIRINSHYYYY